jgi:hypothetical protein
MSPFKHKRVHRSKTDRLPQSIPIIPLHRESIAYPLPAKQGSRPPQGSPVMRDAGGTSGKKATLSNASKPNTLPLPPLREAASSVDDDPEEHYSKWMASYAINPTKDVDNTCLGMWATCALYGKTHWRLQQIGAGKSPLDDAWHSKDAFNSACWAQWGSSFFMVDALGG